MSEDKSLPKRLLGAGHVPTLRKKLARSIYYVPTIVAEAVRDAKHYLTHSGTLNVSPIGQLSARITQTYHNIEKGLSLPAPRPRFGAVHLANLIDYMRTYRDLYEDGPELRSARDVLAAYAAFHDSIGVDDYPYKRSIGELVAEIPSSESQMGGLRKVYKRDILAATQDTDEKFFLQRHSIRKFTEEDVDLGLIETAIKVAQKAPAVCNRQSGFVHVITDKKLIEAALKLQGGARGFAEGVNKVAVVTTDTRSFSHITERNQGWIDGGLFAMSFLYGLHMNGLGTCCLNWSKTNAQSDAMRKLIGANPWESIIMLVAIGHLQDEFEVPFSIRKDPASISRVIVDWSESA